MAASIAMNCSIEKRARQPVDLDQLNEFLREL